VIRACDNPFAVHRVLQQRYRLTPGEWTRLREEFTGHKHRGAIIGPHGAGKTTLLEDLGIRLENSGWRLRWVRLNRESPRITAALATMTFRRLGPCDLVLLDGAEQLGPIGWWRFRWQTRRAGGCIITAHTPGRLPTLWRCGTSPGLLQAIVQDLGVSCDREEATRLHARHTGNIRDALRELYDRFGSAE
jgi:hypothetical protein